MRELETEKIPKQSNKPFMKNYEIQILQSTNMWKLETGKILKL